MTKTAGRKIGKMKWKNITVTARNGAIIYEGPLNELPVKEEYIIEKSRELYNEEEPCIIYRTHITKKLYLDIWDQLKDNQKKKRAADCNSYRELLSPLVVNMEDATLEFQ